MKIALCIKQVPVSDQVKIDPVTHNLIRENSDMAMNPADMNALTEAMGIKKAAGAVLDVFTMGTGAAADILRTAMAIGADNAYLVTDRAFAGGDSLGTAKVLKAAIESVDSYDLIICGALASDGATSQTGPMLAQLFGIPSVTDVKKTEDITEDGKLTVYKAWKGNLAKLKLSLPGLITVSLGCNSPILPTLRNQMKAKKREIISITNSELCLDPEKIGKKGALSVVTDTYMRPQSEKHSKMITGTADEIAAQILDLIKEN